jgi:sec-independent protein translocase protein TatB
VFNVTGGELLIILVIALVVLGPEKLPEMIRKVGRVYGELRRMSSGFQEELRGVLDEPLREVRETVDMARTGFSTAAAETEAAPASGATTTAVEMAPAQPADATPPPGGTARAASSDAWWFTPPEGEASPAPTPSWVSPSPVERRGDLPPPRGRELPPPTSGPVA